MDEKQFQAAAERLAKLQAATAAAQGANFGDAIQRSIERLNQTRAQIAELDNHPARFVHRSRMQFELDRATHRDQEVVTVARIERYRITAAQNEETYSRLRAQSSAAETLFDQLLTKRAADRHEASRLKEEHDLQARRQGA